MTDPRADARQTPMRQHFEHQAQACDRLGSPFTARLCRLLVHVLDRTTRTGTRVLDWPGNPRDDAMVLRLCGALHKLVLAGADDELASAYPPNRTDDVRLEGAVRTALRRHDGTVFTNLDSPPQTNEIARAGMLLPGFLAIGRETSMPMDVREIGSSAGLNLNFDRFHYRYGDMSWGDEASPVRLSPEVRGNPPPLGGFLDIASRKGCDLSPPDIADPESRLRIKSYLWPDQTARLARFDAALAIADAEPPAVEKGSAETFLSRELAARDTGRTFVLFHSVMWQYMPETVQRAIEDMLDDAGNAPGSAPLAWLRMEPVSRQDPFTVLRLTLWPQGETRDLARCDFHGRWIEWLGEA